MRLGYRLFAKSCRLVFVDLQIAQREEQALIDREEQKRKPIPLEDQTYAPDENPGAKDPVYAAAAKAMAELPKSKADIKGADEETVPEKATPTPEKADAALSIGEAPVKHSGKPKRGGARPRKQS